MVCYREINFLSNWYASHFKLEPPKLQLYAKTVKMAYTWQHDQARQLK